MTKRRQQAIETKQKLLDAADQLVKERGFDAVSVDDIVAACGLAKGTFYHHFTSKDDLLVYLTRTPYDELKKKYASTEGQPNLQRLRLFMHEWFNMAAKYNLHFTVLFNRMTFTESLEHKSANKISQMDEGLNIVLECLEHAVEQGELKADTPVEDLARTILFSMQGSTLYQNQHPDTFDIEAWAKSFTDLTFDHMLDPWRHISCEPHL
jgi:AcrR family transcriptional regulator